MDAGDRGDLLAHDGDGVLALQLQVPDSAVAELEVHAHPGGRRVKGSAREVFLSQQNTEQSSISLLSSLILILL